MNESPKIQPRRSKNCSTPPVEFKKLCEFSPYMERWRIHFEEKLRKIENSGKPNKQIILDYIKHKRSEGVTYHRLARISDFMWHLLNNFDFDFSKLNQQQIEKILIWLNEQEWKDWTKYSYGRILKNFLYWLEDKYGLKLRVKDLKMKKPKNSLLPEYLISEEEFNRLFNATDDLQMRVILGLLYESACRIGEILSLRIQNVSFNSYGAKILVKGKTGQRIVPIVWFANLLRQFIESHPFRDKPESSLFFYKNSKGETVPLNYDTLRMRLKRLCKKAGINKKITPHLFRHSRLTELARELPEQILKQVAGWVPDSRMAQTYIHLSAKNIEESLLSRVYGIKVGNEEKEKFRVCPKCGEMNPYFAKICQRCKTYLDEKKAMETILSEEKIKEIDEWADVFLTFFKIIEKRYPDVWREMAEILKEKRKEHLLRFHK